MIITLLQWYLAIGILFAIIMHLIVNSNGFREWLKDNKEDNIELPSTFYDHFVAALGYTFLYPYFLYVWFIRKDKK